MLLAPVMHGHLPALPRILVVPVTLVDELSDRYSSVQENAHLTVLREDHVRRRQGCSAPDVNAFFAVVGHVERDTALSEIIKNQFNL